MNPDLQAFSGKGGSIDALRTILINSCRRLEKNAQVFLFPDGARHHRQNQRFVISSATPLCLKAVRSSTRRTSGSKMPRPPVVRAAHLAVAAQRSDREWKELDELSQKRANALRSAVSTENLPQWIPPITRLSLMVSSICLRSHPIHYPPHHDTSLQPAKPQQLLYDHQSTSRRLLVPTPATPHSI